MRSRPVLAVLALLVVATLHFLSVPRSIWEYDENLYAMAVERFEPLLHHPPPPGSPVYIAFVKVIALVTETFKAMLTTSILAVAAGLVAFFFAFRELTGSARVGVIATILLWGSPALLMSGTLPQADAGAMALFGLAIWACARGNPVLLAVACAATVGWRVQTSIAIVPMFFAALFFLKTWRERLIALGTFTVACLAWLLPLVVLTGGPSSFWGWLSGQAAYFARHDADLSRSGHSASHIALRFIAHPWGPKWLSIPLLGLALLGIRRNRRLIPLAAGCLAYLAFALVTMDPADAVRYAIPSLPLFALLAAVPLAGPRFAPALAVVYALCAYAYASPILHLRASSDAPPAAAAKWMEEHVPKDALVLYEMPLGPHASYLLRDWKTMRIDAGLAHYGGDASKTMYLFADGERGDEKGTTFRWPDTDAYRKLTRQHYGAVSVIPLPPEQRFRVVEGVFPPERRRDGTAWRWISRRAVIELPSLGATQARVVLRIPPEYPLDGNRVRVNDATVTLRRGHSASLIVPLTSNRITFEADQAFVPARIPNANNRDLRMLSVMLVRVEQLDPRTR